MKWLIKKLYNIYETFVTGPMKQCISVKIHGFNVCVAFFDKALVQSKRILLALFENSVTIKTGSGG